MGRKRRPDLPGAIFHVTARTQGREPWFTPLVRDRVVEYAAAAVTASGSRLLAYAIMPNHMHLVLCQGRWPLGRIMQPLLRRTALLVQRCHGVDGHVFERRFGARECPDPAYVRNAIVYTNLNPVRAELVEDPCGYPRSTHSLYIAADGAPDVIAAALAVDDALRLFAPRVGTPLDELRRAYVRYVEWRIEADRHRAAEALGEVAMPAPVEPCVMGGDHCWSRRLVPLFKGPPELQAPGAAGCGAPAVDLGVIARQTLAERAPGLDLDRVRSGYKGRTEVSVRRVMVRRMDAAGHAGAAIARYLRVSDQCVSNILRSQGA